MKKGFTGYSDGKTGANGVRAVAHVMEVLREEKEDVWRRESAEEERKRKGDATLSSVKVRPHLKYCVQV